MSLRPEELTLLAAELTRELEGSVVQKVSAPTTSRVYVECRVPGRSHQILLCAEPSVARLSAVEVRPPNPPVPPTWQSVLRTELVGARWVDVEALPLRRTALIHFKRGERFLTLVLELTAQPMIFLTTADGAIRTQSIPARPGLRVGQRWTPVDEHPVKEQGSRLLGDHVALRLAHAAEALFTSVEQRSSVDARRAPLVAKLKRLDRTRDKVRAEASRAPMAEAHRREGELLTQNLGRLTRGPKTFEATEYLADGTTRSVSIALDPKRTPQQEVEHRFHQYKRLLRGVTMAEARLRQLDVEAQSLQTQLEALANAPPEPLRLPTPKRSRERESAPSLPYREYRGHGDQRIWVGRGSAHNDALTFHQARPHHVWFHARGVPGAHVVVPLEKGQTLAPEVLLDAAHLAAHHSDAKGEPRVEVAHTLVKFVHKAKGAAPGVVTYTRERSLLLRVEAERLQRLLRSVNEP